MRRARSSSCQELTVQYLDSKVTSTRFDLEFHVWEAADALSMLAFYNTDLFDRSTIESMLGHYQNILAAAVSNPSQPIADLPLLSASERTCLVEQWNHTTTDFPRDRCFHELFTQQAMRPRHGTGWFGNQELTYAELDRRESTRRITYASSVFGPESRVAICIERSLDMVVGVLSVLKARRSLRPAGPQLSSRAA